MGVVKNLMVRVGADLSGLVSGFNQGAKATGNFKKQTGKALKESAMSLGILKKAMASGGKNAEIVSLVDQIKELESGLKAAGEAGFGWGYESFENDVLFLRDLKTQLNEYVAKFNQEPDGPNQWIARLRELQAAQAQLNTGEIFGARSEMDDLNFRIAGFTDGLRNAVNAAQPLGAQLAAAKNSLREMERAGLGIGDAAWDEMYQTVSRLSEAAREYKAALDDVGDETTDTERKTSRLGFAAKSALGWFRQGAAGISNIGKSAKSSSRGVESLLRSIRRIGLFSVGLRLVRSIFGELQSIVHQYISENATLQAQVTALKSSLGQALAPAINLVTNALSILMPYIVGFSNAVSSLITSLFGTGWTTVADGANSAASAIGGAGSAQKELNRQLAGFDEITKLNSQSAGGGGGGVSSSLAAAIEGKLPPGFSGFFNELNEAISNGDWAGVGETLAGGINSGISYINGMDVSFGTMLSGLINDGISLASGFVGELDWYGLGVAIENNIADCLRGIDWEGLWALLWDLGSGLLTTLDGFRMELLKDVWGSTFHGTQFEADAVNTTNGALGSVLNIVNIFKDLPAAIAEPGALNPIAELTKNLPGEIAEHRRSTHSGKLGNTSNPSGEYWKNKFLPFSVKLVSWKDSLKEKVVPFDAELTSWQDSLKEKNVSFTSELTSWEDALKNKTIRFGSRITSWKDALKNKVISFQSQITSWKDTLPNKVVSFKARLTTWVDALADKILSFKSRITSWEDNISNKKLDFKAQITPGWTGNAASALGISTITSKLKLSLPKVTVSWEADYSGDKTSSNVKKPIFSVAYYAKGGIMNAAQVFGRIGNQLLVGGEAGREAILPLERNTWWMDKIADRVALRVNGGSQAGDQNITINLVVDGKKVASTVVRHVNAEARATGRHPFAAYI